VLASATLSQHGYAQPARLRSASTATLSLRQHQPRCSLSVVGAGWLSEVRALPERWHWRWLNKVGAGWLAGWLSEAEATPAIFSFSLNFVQPRPVFAF